MSESKSLLYTAHDGSASGPPFLVLHERYGSLENARALGNWLGDSAFRVAVRSARLQTIGGDGETQGFFWFVGPEDHPEMSTLGDVLYQLELMLMETYAECGDRKVGLLGAGEGGVLALLMGLIRPELTSVVVAIDARLPRNFSSIPIEIPPLDQLPVFLVHRQTAPHPDTVAVLAKLGAAVTERSGDFEARCVMDIAHNSGSAAPATSESRVSVA